MTVSLEVSLHSLKDLSDSGREGTSPRDETIEEAYAGEEADASYFGKINIPVTNKCTNLWKLFQKLDIETNVIVETNE